MALLELTNHESSWYCIRMQISLCCIVLLNANFQSYSIQAPSNAFAYPTWVVQITTTRSSSHSTLAYTLRGMDPTPHVVMPISLKVWLEASLMNVGLMTSSVSRKTTWSLSHSRFVCILALAIAFYSLQQYCAKGLFKTRTFMATWSWCLMPSSWVDGRSGLSDSINKLWCARKCCTKLYLAV
jgi:hypothetical protein